VEAFPLAHGDDGDKQLRLVRRLQGVVHEAEPPEEVTEVVLDDDRVGTDEVIEASRRISGGDVGRVYLLERPVRVRRCGSGTILKCAAAPR
jgi:hypothetical protein